MKINFAYTVLALILFCGSVQAQDLAAIDLNSDLDNIALLPSIVEKPNDPKDKVITHDKEKVGFRSMKIELLTEAGIENIDIDFPEISNGVATLEILKPTGELVFRFKLPASAKPHKLHLQQFIQPNELYHLSISNDVIQKTLKFQID